MNPMLKTRYILNIILLISCLPQQAVAEAYCALRDPVEAIQLLYPHADGHRSIVRAVDNAVREEILETLSFSLHFNELGKHTLYTILKDKETIGFVHVRSELAPWGLMEVAWALSPDLSLQNFMFQRCRSAICAPETIEAMLSLLAGKSLSEIKGYLSEGGKELMPNIAKQVDISDKAFVAALIRSALKTIAVTSITWKEEVEDIQRQKVTSGIFDPKPSRVAETDISESARSALKNIHQGGGSLINPASVRAFSVLHADAAIGYLVSGQWQDQHTARVTHWVFDTEGRVLKTATTPTFEHHEDTALLQQLVGQNVSVSENCLSASALMAHDLYFLASFGVP